MYMQAVCTLALFYPINIYHSLSRIHTHANIPCYYISLTGYDGIDFFTSLHSHIYKVLQEPTKAEHKCLPVKEQELSNKEVEEMLIHPDRTQKHDDSDSEEKKRLEKELGLSTNDLILPSDSKDSNKEVDVTLEKM